MSLAKLSRDARHSVETQPVSELGGQPQAALLRSLTDPAFRARVELDPASALAELGFDLDPAQIPARVVLPNADALERGADRLEASGFDRFIPWMQLLPQSSQLH